MADTKDKASDEHEGKQSFYFPVQDVVIWAVDAEDAQEQLTKSEKATEAEEGNK